MRIDKYLKISRIIKRRTVAKDACDKGRVLLNGREAKAGAEVSVGDEVTVLFGGGTLHVRILSVQEQVRKEEAAGMYEAIQD